MLSKVKYTAPKNLEADKTVVIELATEKNGVLSDPIGVTLTAKAPVKPNEPTISGPDEVEENTTETYNLTFNETDAFDVSVTTTNGTATLSESKDSVSFTAPSVEKDEQATLTVTATRGTKSTSVTKAITIKNQKSEALVAFSSNATEVEEQAEVVISFTNAVGVLNVTEISDTITAVVDNQTVKVTGVKAGAGSFKVSQTETGKSESEAITITITVTAKAEQSESEGKE